MKHVDERASNYIIDAAKSSDNFYVKGLADRDLIAREAHYHTSSYKTFTKPQKVPSHNDPYKEAEKFTFKEIFKKCHKLNLKPKNKVFYRTCYSHEGHHAIQKCNNGRVDTRVFRERIRKALY